MSGVAVGPEQLWFRNTFTRNMLLQSDHLSWQSNPSKKLPPTATFSGDLRRRMAAIEQELHEPESIVPSDAVFTSGQTLEKPKKGATLSHFFSGARRLFGRRSCSTSHFVVKTFDREGPFSTSQKASWRTCTGTRPTISADVHYFPVNLSSATQRVRPGRLTTPQGVSCPRKKSP
jgi:hypothetical protein